MSGPDARVTRLVTGPSGRVTLLEAWIEEYERRAAQGTSHDAGDDWIETRRRIRERYERCRDTLLNLALEAIA